MPKSRLAIVALVAANVFPIVAVLFLGWEVSELLALFWTETAVIGLFNVFKMLRIGGLKAIFLCVFFTVHFGGFMAGHGFFLLHMFGADQQGQTRDVWELLGLVRWQLLALVLSHGYSFFVYFISGNEYQHRKLQKQMFVPYPRIVVMHITIIFGSMLAMTMGARIAPLLILIALKVVADIFSHRREHRR